MKMASAGKIALGGPTTLHAHSRDAAQQGFYKACKTARACGQVGLDISTPTSASAGGRPSGRLQGIRLHAGMLLLKRARGWLRSRWRCPPNLLALPAAAFLEVRLVWDRAARHYTWHLVVEDGTKPAPRTTGGPHRSGRPGRDSSRGPHRWPGNGHHHLPGAARQCSSTPPSVSRNYAPNRPASSKGSRALRRLQRRKSRFLAKQKRRARDMEHKISRAVVNWAKERQVSTLVIGDVRDVADGKRLNTKSQQKIGLWSHGRQRAYITYKAAAAGIAVTLVEEASTSQTCPGTLPDGTGCLQCYKPKGRVYRCPACGFTAHRDGVGVPTCSPSTIRGSRGMSSHLRKRIVTQTRGSVAAWTRRTWLGFQPLARTRPRSCGARAPAECHSHPS